MAVKRLCEACKLVRKKRKLYVYCKENPRHKQRQCFSTVPELLLPPVLDFPANFVGFI